MPITEIVSDNDFFDYKAKYLGESQEITPARISDDMTNKVQTVAKQVYEILKMDGFTRSEYIFKDGKLIWKDLKASTAKQAEDVLKALENIE